MKTPTSFRFQDDGIDEYPHQSESLAILVGFECSTYQSFLIPFLGTITPRFEGTPNVAWHC